MGRPRRMAPLVEVIAELRWESSAGSGVNGQFPLGPTFIAAQGKAETFFMKFAGEVHALEHREVERLVPAGFPFFATQPVVRFRRGDIGQPKTLYQVGPGIFSANAVPPYESWSTRFRDVVARGVAALIRSRPADELASPFTGLTLRYIDAFDHRHTEGRPVDAFIREVLGINVLIPKAIAQHLGEGAHITPMVQLQIPMESAFMMGLSVSQGSIDGRSVVMLDSSVAATLPIPCDENAVMAAFQSAHDALSLTFEQLIKPIDRLMPELQEDGQ